jgi:hypothetical protein
MDFAGYWLMRRGTLAALVLLVTVTACSADKTPNAPEAGGLNLTATWAGPIVVGDTGARMTWTLTQVNSAVSGPATVLLSNGIVLLNGFLTGTLSGMTLSYTISVENGGVPTRPTCAGQLAGTMAVTAGTTSTLTGPMGVSSSNCTPPFDTSTITLTRQ